MAFSYTAGFTRLVNILTILVLISDVLDCQIADIFSMIESSIAQIMNIIYLIVLYTDIILVVVKNTLIGTVIMIVDGMNIAIETAVQFLPSMKINVWIIILLVCIVMTSILLDCWIQCCIIGAILSGVSKINPRELRYITISGSTNESEVSVPVKRRL